MAHENCILLSNSLDLALVRERLLTAFGNNALEITETAGAWSKIRYTRRKLLMKASLEFAPLNAEQLAEAQKRLKHVYVGIPAENPDIQKRLLTKIATSRLAIDVQAPSGMRGMEEAVFVVAEALDAIIFWQGNKMLNKKGQLILDFEGRTGVKELEVWVDSTEFDSLIPATASGQARKARIEAFVKSKKIPIAQSLPPIDGDDTAKIRSTDEVTGRALALLAVAVKAEGLEAEILNQVIAQFEIAQFFTPDERAFIADPEPGQQDKINFIWRYEGLWVLLWALGFIEELPFPDKICDVERSVGLVHGHGTLQAFREKSQLRPAGELLDACDLAYRLHWAAVDARLRNEAPPAGMDPGVVYERHYALNWLRCYHDQDWDDVRTDT